MGSFLFLYNVENFYFNTIIYDHIKGGGVFAVIKVIWFFDVSTWNIAVKN